MSVNKKELHSVIENFTDVPIVVVGDLIVDNYVWGTVDRVSPEAPVVVVTVTGEGRRLGGAGNVVHNLTNLGAKVFVTGIVGDDDRGDELIFMLEQLGAVSDGIVIDTTRPTTSKTRVIAHAQQVVRVDHETVEPLSNSINTEVIGRFLDYSKHARGVIVSDYAKGVITARLCQTLSDGFVNGRYGENRSPVLIDPKNPNFLIYKNATIIKPNRKEAEEAIGRKISSRADAIQASTVFFEKWKTEMVLVTLGSEGMVLIDKNTTSTPVEVETVAREVYDVSGAGDTVSAVFLLALSSGATPEQAAVLSNLAAGVVVGEVGTVPITRDQLIEAINQSRY